MVETLAHPGVVEAVFETAGLPYHGERAIFDTTSSEINDYAAIFQEREQALVYVRAYIPGKYTLHRGPGEMRPLTETHPAIAFRGLLREDEGDFPLSVYNEAGKSFDRRVQITVYGNEAAISDAQKAFGKTPGEDALHLTPSGRQETEPAGEYIEGLADGLRVPRAQISAKPPHDLECGDHVPTLLSLPPEYARYLGNRAQVLIDRYGSRIHMPDNERRPREIGRFVNGVDGLESIINFTNKVLFQIEEEVDAALQNQTIQSPRQTLEDYVTGKGEWRYRSFTHFAPFEFTGLADPGAGHGNVIELASELIAHMAQMRIDLEDIRPKKDDTPKLRAARVNAWNDIVKEFKAA